MIWTDRDINKYGTEIAEMRKLGVRWCTLIVRYKKIFPDICEGEVKRLLCLYEAAQQSVLLGKGEN